MRRHLLGSIMAICIPASVAYAYETVGPDISWVKANQAALSSYFFNAGRATQFVHWVTKNDLSGGDYSETSVVKYQFFDLNGDGSLQLLCTINPGGNAYTSDLMVIGRNGEHYVHDIATSGDIELDDPDAMVVDIHHDGRKEIIVPAVLEDTFQRTEPQATITHIYRFNGKTLDKVDKEFPEYYGARLKEIYNELQQLRAHHLTGSEEHDRDMQIRADLIESKAIHTLLSTSK